MYVLTIYVHYKRDLIAYRFKMSLKKNNFLSSYSTTTVITRLTRARQLTHLTDSKLHFLCIIYQLIYD